MNINLQKQGPIQIYKLQGRLDNSGAKSLEQELKVSFTGDVLCVLFDMEGMDYLSSAGLRIILVLYKRLKAKNGELALIGVGEYCREVLNVTGFAETFPIFQTMEAANNFARRFANDKHFSDNWLSLGERILECGTVKVMPTGVGKTSVKLYGDIKELLYSGMTAPQVVGKKLSELKYSFGIGALGKDVDACMPVLGQMMTTGRAIEWLPADGADIADMLVVQQGQGEITVRSAFNISIQDGFNEHLFFQSAETGGTDLTTLFRALFKMAKSNCPDYKGLIAVCMRADIGELYGNGMKRPPIQENAPKDGKTINHPNNVKSWFNRDESHRFNNVTSLIVGVGLNLMDDLSEFDENVLGKMFHLNPANLGGKSEILMLHGASFGELAFPDRPVDLDREIDEVLKNGEFLDMRQLGLHTTINKALIGISYVCDCELQPIDPPLSGTKKPVGTESPPSAARKKILNAYHKIV